MAMRWLHRTDRSRRHIETRLLERGGDPSDVRAVLDDFIERGWINDRRCAEALRDRWCRTAPMAPDALAARLEAEGIERELALEISRVNEPSPVELAVQLAAQRLPRLSDLPPETRARRLLGLLARRGFEEEVALEALERLAVLPE
tara:strand:- start:34458 stop:34895 length:438 start_codon:yes stop_codon:yes gene_type:complete